MAHINEFNQKKDQLLDLILDCNSIFADLGMTNEKQKNETIFQKLKEHAFKVLIMGQFKVGKSTFINALLGQEVLPAYATPCTAIINEVKYSDEKKAFVYFKNPVPKALPEDIEPSIKTYIEKGNGKDLNPIKINVTELEKFVVINDPTIDPAKSVSQTPFEKVELYWDLSLCKDGVEIIDSPGLNDNKTLTLITLNYLSKVDAVVFVMNCQAICGMTEIDVIENDLIRFGHEYLFFVNNRINQIQPNQRDKVIDFGNRKLSPKTKFGEKGVFYIDALGALEGRLNKNNEMVEKSGILQVEEKLEYFLANTRGRIKLEQPARNTINAINHALADVIPNEERMLSVSIQEIENKINIEKPRLDRLKRDKEQIIQRISSKIDRICIDTLKLINSRFSELNSKTPIWINEIQLENSFSPMHAKDSANKIIEEILKKYQAKLEKEQIEWTSNTLNPFVQDKLEDLQDEFKTKLENFYLEVDSVKMKISGVDVSVRDPSKGERIGATIAGLFVDAGSAWYGAQFGFGPGLFKQMALQIGAIITMILVGITNPLTMIPVILTIAFIGILTGGRQVTNKIKQEIISKVCAQIRNKAPEQTEEMINQIKTNLNEITNSIRNGLENELNSVDEQVHKVLEEKRRGEAKVAERKRKLDLFKQQLLSTKNKIDALIKTL